MLGVLGLAAAEEQLYEWLLEHAPVSLADLDDGVRDQAWAAQTPALLVGLERLGLLVPLPGDPPGCQVVPPDIAFNALALSGERALTEARERRSELSAAFRGAGPLADATPPAEVIRGRQAIGQCVERMERAARQEFRCCDTPPYVGAASQVNTLELEQLRAGIRYRVLYDRQGLAEPGRLADLEAGLAAGEQARVTDVPVKLVLSDCTLALLPLQPDVGAVLLVRDPTLVGALSALFEACWDSAIPLPIRNGQPQMPASTDPGPTSADCDLLRLLAAGFTDRLIARQLGCNERTVRRYLNDMMRRLDAATRFQAGYQAVLRGWLTGPGSG